MGGPPNYSIKNCGYISSSFKINGGDRRSLGLKRMDSLFPQPSSLWKQFRV